ncbi:MAG: cell division protein SepF [Propionibacteriaceae bacterium]
MADLLRKGATWLGLVVDDNYSDSRDQNYEEYGEDDYESTEMVDFDEDSEPTNVTQLPRRRPQGARTDTYRPSPIPEESVADLSKIVTVSPRSYNDARTIGEHYRDNIPVIMNLTEMDDADAKRLVDFAAGLVFGLRGTIERVTSKVFLLSPLNISVAAEDKERIAGGFYNQS